MKLALKILGVFLGLATGGYGSEFTQEKFQDIRRDFYPYPLKQEYKEILDEELCWPEKAVREFRLESGIDVQITEKSLELIKNSYNIPSNLQGIILGTEYQPYKISNDKEEVVTLRQIYGKQANEKFSSADMNALALAMLLPDKKLLIKEKMYEITITDIFFTEQSKPLIENTLINHQGDLIIRYLSDAHKDTYYAVFIENKNKFNLKYGSETLLAHFMAKQVARPL